MGKGKAAAPAWVDPLPTPINGGRKGALDRIVACWERCRDKNSAGYAVKTKGVLVYVQGWEDRTKDTDTGTVCSPFTASIVAMTFDPDGGADMAEPFKPIFNGLKDRKPLPYDFYKVHNDNRGVEGILKYKLGYEIDPKDMRRGDFIEWNWNNATKEHGAGGHAAFCWDVHTSANGEVDCFLLLSSNGYKDGAGYHGIGVSVSCIRNYDKFVKLNGTTYTKVKTPLFADDLEYVRSGHWLGLPPLKKGDIDAKTFKDEIYGVFYAGSNGLSILNGLRAARFFGFPPPTRAGADSHFNFDVAKTLVIDGEKQPEPYANGTLPEKKTSDSKTHFEKAKPVIVVKAAGAAAPSSSPAAAAPSPPPPQPKASSTPAPQPKKVKQLPDAIARYQHDTELLLRRLFDAKAIDSDPGSSDDIYDSHTKAAVLAFQKKFNDKYHFTYLDGIPGPETREALKNEAALLNKPPAATPADGSPRIDHIYWGRNQIDPGGVVRVGIAGIIDELQTLTIHLESTDGKKADLPYTPLMEFDEIAVADITLPAMFTSGTQVVARVDGKTASGATASKASDVPLYVGRATYPVIAKGEESENVRIFQFLLNEHLSFWKGMQVSAVFDKKTVDLMQQFQKASSLPTTDVPNDPTWAALEAASTALPLLGDLRPWKIPLWTKRKFHATYSDHEGDLWTHTLPSVSYAGIDGVAAASGTPILYITKLSTDDDGISKGGDGTKVDATSLKWEDGTSLDSNVFPYLALGGAHVHDFGILPGDVGVVIRNGKVAFGVYGDSAGSWAGDETDADRKLKIKSAAFRCHRSGEASVKIHDLLGLRGGSNENMRSEFIWIVFPGTTFCKKFNRLSKSIDADAIAARGKALLALIGGKPDLAS